jgi:hypothetical protein
VRGRVLYTSFDLLHANLKMITKIQRFKKLQNKKLNMEMLL